MIGLITTPASICIDKCITIRPNGTIEFMEGCKDDTERAKLFFKAVEGLFKDSLSVEYKRGRKKGYDDGYEDGYEDCSDE